MELDLISATEAAKILRVERQTITRWCREGKLRAKIVGKRWVIDRRSAEELRQKKTEK